MAPFFCLSIWRISVLHAQPDALQVCRNDLIPILFREISGKYKMGTRYPRVIACHIQSAIGFYSLFHQRLDIRCLGHVRTNKSGSPSAAAYHLHGLLALLAASRSDNHLRPFIT